jgi:hypothetical protein
MVKSEVVLILPPIALFKYKGDTGETRLPGPLDAATAPTQRTGRGQSFCGEESPYGECPFRPFRRFCPFHPN